MRGRLGVLAAATAVVIGAGYLTWSPPARPSEGVGRSRSRGHAAVDHQELQRLIAAYESRVRAGPNAADYAFLAQLYLQRGRGTGDVGTYLQAEQAVTAALALAPTDSGARVLLGGVRYTTHDFPGALDLARQVLTENPDQVGALGLAGDAQLELGAYTEAAQAYAKVVATSPDAPAIEVRQARLAFIQGRVEQARRLAAKAESDAKASALGGVELAYYEAFHGQVELDVGHYAMAAQFYTEALEEAPGYYVALAGLARTRAVQGRLGEAIGLYEKTVATLPQPDFVAALGDLYTLTGDTAKAKLEYGTVEVIATLARINRQIYNRQLALFDADHGVRLDEGVRLADTELSVRKDVYGYDADAWALYKIGRYAEARAAAEKALAQGTRDARILYHAGLIDEAVGHPAVAMAELRQALAISPNFDPLQAPGGAGPAAQPGQGALTR
jgi:tetratricopeptide (TPR) repeat protein